MYLFNLRKKLKNYTVFFFCLNFKNETCIDVKNRKSIEINITTICCGRNRPRRREISCKGEIENEVSHIRKGVLMQEMDNNNNYDRTYESSG